MERDAIDVDPATGPTRWGSGVIGLPAGLLGLAALFFFRAVVASLRRYGPNRLLDNPPILLMRDDP